MEIKCEQDIINLKLILITDLYGMQYIEFFKSLVEFGKQKL